MAIKISGTTVIDNSRNLTNIAQVTATGMTVSGTPSAPTDVITVQYATDNLGGTAVAYYAFGEYY